MRFLSAKQQEFSWGLQSNLTVYLSHRTKNLRQILHLCSSSSKAFSIDPHKFHHSMRYVIATTRWVIHISDILMIEVLTRM